MIDITYRNSWIAEKSPSLLMISCWHKLVVESKCRAFIFGWNVWALSGLHGLTLGIISLCFWDFKWFLFLLKGFSRAGNFDLFSRIVMKFSSIIAFLVGFWYWTRCSQPFLCIIYCFYPLWILWSSSVLRRLA